jgi:hypothetical protein
MVEWSDACSGTVLSIALNALWAFNAWCAVNGLLTGQLISGFQAQAAQQPASTSHAALGAIVMQQLQDVGVPPHLENASAQQLSAQPASAATSSLNSNDAPT